MHHTLIDSLACGDSFVHKLDSRVKLIATIVFTLCVLSAGRMSVSILFCYAVGPFAMLVIGRVPLKIVAKHIAVVSPFIAAVAVSSIFYDKTRIDIEFGPFQWGTTAGTVRCFSIVGKFIITVSTLVLLASTTRFNDLLAAMRQFGMPKIMITQLSFLWRYIFMLIDRATHMLRARAGRKLGFIGISKEIATAGSMAGSLLMSSVNTANRVNIAMLARGFDGDIRSHTNNHTHRGDWVFVAVAVAYLGVLYLLRGSF